LQDDTIWVATTDSSVYGWPAEGQTPQKVFQKGGSFLAGNLSFSRARASLEGSAPVSLTSFLAVSKRPCSDLSNDFTVLRWVIITHYLQGMLSVMIVPPAVADDLVVYIEINYVHSLWKESGKK
jgi:hypothetical protein